VEAYLTSRYRPEAVRHTFTSATGDTIDCVDFAEEPGVREMLSRGETVDGLLASLHASEAAHAASHPPSAARLDRGDAHFDGLSDALGARRACPERTVPHARLTAEKIEGAGGLDAYLAHRAAEHVKTPADTHAVEPDVQPGSGGFYTENPPYAHVFAVQHAAANGAVNGGIATMTITDDFPSSFVNHSTNHTLQQIWIIGGTGSGTQTLEAGSKFSADIGGPYLWVGGTQDDYKDFCENGSKAWGTTTCVTWVPNPSATLALGQTLPASTPGGVQHELTLDVELYCWLRSGFPNLQLSCNWDVSAGVDGAALTYLGYFAESGYNGGALALGKATVFETGGEVRDDSNNFTEVEMGEQPMLIGLASYGHTAYVRNFGYYSNLCIALLGGCQPQLVQTGATVYYTNGKFTYNTGAAAGSPSWTNWFYYGDFVPLMIPIVPLGG
jgi:hypothetical protein